MKLTFGSSNNVSTKVTKYAISFSKNIFVCQSFQLSDSSGCLNEQFKFKMCEKRGTLSIFRKEVSSIMQMFEFANLARINVCDEWRGGNSVGTSVMFEPKTALNSIANTQISLFI
jgi:hypothetical protein